jgi:hypothetical protein
MALLSMRKFAKVTGISYYNIKKYIEDGVIKADENGMLESSESIRILRKELNEGIKHYAVFLSSSPLVKDGIKELMNKENAVEVKSYDSIIIEYNKSLTDKSVEVSESISRKYKELVLEEFARRYKACVKRQADIACDNTEILGIPYPKIKEFLATGIFPEGYKHLEGANINSYVTQGIERFLLKLNNNMQKKFDKICKDLLLYWDSDDDKTVFTRADLSPEFLSEMKHSQLYENILNNPLSFMVGRDLEHPTPIFESLKSGYKTVFKPTVLSEFSKKRFYHIIDVHKDMSHDECVDIICDLRASENVECFVCGTKDMSNAYIPESVLVYLDCMQRERKESVVYLDGVNTKTGVASSVAGKESNSGVEQEKAEIKHEPVSEAESSTVKHEPDLKVEASNVKQESDSGVETSPKPAEPVSAQPEVEVIPASSVEVVSEGKNARDSIKGLLSSLG